MKLIFAGTPEFAARALRALLGAACDVVLVLTREDKPSGRGMETQISAVKKLALEHGLRLHQPRTLKDPSDRQPLAEARADLMVVAAYGLILPQAVLDIPPMGAINIHASLLPRWRGAAPIQRALLAGDSQTGVSIMKMEAGLDTGPVLLSVSTPIGEDDTAGTLHDRLAELGAEAVLEIVRRIESGTVEARPQNDSFAIYAPKLQKSESRVDWGREAAVIHRQIRAFNPAPGCSARWRGEELKIWQAVLLRQSHGMPGEILSVDNAGVLVACGQGALRLTQLQRPGGRKLAAADFLRGFTLAPGESFEV